MSDQNKDGTDMMMAMLMGLSGPRASRAWTEAQEIQAMSFLTLAEHWINQTAAENARLKAEVERLRKAGDMLCFHYIYLARKRWPDDPLPPSITEWNAAKEGKPSV